MSTPVMEGMSAIISQYLHMYYHAAAAPSVIMLPSGSLSRSTLRFPEACESLRARFVILEHFLNTCNQKTRHCLPVRQRVTD